MSRKYRNQPTVVDGVRFDSKAEAKRWQMLKILEKTGAIDTLNRQVRVPLIVDGSLVATMRWDFYYIENWRQVYDDTKGMKPTPDWRIKLKLFKALSPTAITRINGVAV